jgi:hypothetical protein
MWPKLVGPKLVGLVATMLIALCPGHATAQPEGEAPAPRDSTKEGCTQSYVANQKLRRASRLREARAELLTCAQETCPASIKSDCLKWLDELDDALPTVVLSVTDGDGKDIVDVQVSVDGTKILDRLDGKPLPLDPGEHVLRFERKGMPVVEKQVVVQQGVKNRAIAVTLGEPSDKGGPVPTEGERPVPIAAIVLGVVSLGAFASFAGFGITGKQKVDELNVTCGPEAPPDRRGTCSDEDVDDVTTKFIIADVSLGVGCAAFAVGLGLLLYNLLSDPEPAASAGLRLDLGATPEGAFAGIAAPF